MEVTADNLSKAGWSWAVSQQWAARATIWIVDAHRDEGMRFSVRADQKLTVFVELEARSEISPESSVQAAANEKRPARIGPLGNRRLHTLFCDKIP